ncbi:glycosyltransferase [Neptunitalea lumnitzerae]|uniref:Glycosyl transferase n=1 Tax=Neptunitalea lumnitzerae TaxID=2965509 RepID=A0ABQ5MKQ2_9FLAO|nr:glycosyltransferase [Neptunitalea sp. Y10]GLB49993.1 glycosyl transferase [Neptunitalea sp. Y10]
MPKKLLVIGAVWPEPKSSAAGSRMMQLIEMFQRNAYEVSFVSSCSKTANAVDLDALGVLTGKIVLNSTSFDDYVRELAPDVVLFDRFMTEEQYGWRVAEAVPNALRVLDTEDLHCLRKAREQALKDHNEFSNSYLFETVDAKREIAAIYRCDISLIISTFEMELLTSVFKIPESILYYLPFLLSDEDISNSKPKFSERVDFVTIGSFLHKPNYDAVLHLKKNIWPLIRKQLPEASMLVYGSYESQKVTQLTNAKEHFFIKGFADDAYEVMEQSRVCLAPLRFGAGLKGKILDAMVSGTPCVMSAIAAEGMFDELTNGFIADDEIEFANKAVQLYTNENVWEQFHLNGFKIIKQRFSVSTFESNFMNAIETTTQTIHSHRQQNFTGAMLMHHTLQSTKFMSKWIEAKNKL